MRRLYRFVPGQPFDPGQVVLCPVGEFADGPCETAGQLALPGQEGHGRGGPGCAGAALPEVRGWRSPGNAVGRQQRCAVDRPSLTAIEPAPGLGLQHGQHQHAHDQPLPLLVVLDLLPQQPQPQDCGGGLVGQVVKDRDVEAGHAVASRGCRTSRSTLSARRAARTSAI